VANYDGVAKHRTEVGAHARIGSNSVLVAPVRVGDGAYTAAGSVVDGDVPAGALAVARGRLHVSEGWVARRRPGSAADDASRGTTRQGPQEGDRGPRDGHNGAIRAPDQSTGRHSTGQPHDSIEGEGA
jgi:bifunctional UDP-N-acetylglucosamine pyrophosphorylase/glucosamine-1-phosphate N-acetyltransferase